MRVTALNHFGKVTVLQIEFDMLSLEQNLIYNADNLIML